MNQILTLSLLIGFSFAATGQTADFSYQSTNGLYCTPSIIKFTKTTTGTPIGYVWTFGNNMGSNSENPTTAYTTAGTYTVRLIVIYKKYTVQVSKTVVINPGVPAGFQYSRNTLCMPGTINFNANAENNISSYEWNFGDGTGTITTTSANISHYFPDYNIYPVSFKATAATGCYGQSSTSVTVQRPSINATVSPLSGCTPATVSFNSTVVVPPSASVTNYTWNFGDGSTQTSTTIANTSHNYNAVGSYIPTLHIQTNEGCTNQYSFPAIAFGTPPTNHIAYPKKTIFCGSESPGFVSRAVNANKYFWDFGNGDTTSVYDTVTQHKFRTLGTKTVTVTPLYNDCPGNPISFTVEVIGVIAGYDYANTCASTKRFTFNNTSQGNQSTILWTFGDGSPALQTTNVIHSYPDTGTFVTSLNIHDNITGCSDTYNRNIYTAEPGMINPDNSICKNSITTFNIPHNYNNPDAQYTWNVVGTQVGPLNSLPFTIQANVLGHFNDNFVIIDNGPQYCKDSIRLPMGILVRGPQLGFSAPSELCVSEAAIITNTSAPYIPTDYINNWHWDYNIPGFTLQTDSVFQPDLHYFPYWGSYTVKLTAIDIKGCMDTLAKDVRIYDSPFLRSIPDVDTLCAGSTSTLIAFHNDSITWWPTSTLSCNTCDTVIASPTTTTTYYVKATNRFNCSVTDSIQIFVYPHFTAVAAKPINYICAYESVRLDISPKDKKISWSPVSGLSDSTSFNPIASPRTSTHYTITLTDSAGCFSSSTDVNVYVKSLPSVNAGPNMIYPYNSTFTIAPIYSNNISSYTWTPSTQLTCHNCPSPTGISTTSQNYTVTVISDSGCVAKDNIAIIVECKGANLLLPTAFTPNSDNVNDYYFPITRGIKTITRFAIYSREGILMYELKDNLPNERNRGWDGRYRGMPQSASAYVYVLEAICDAGETIHKQGSFVLLR